MITTTPYKPGTKKHELFSSLVTYRDGITSYEIAPCDPNHNLRCMYRCYVDGSYTGEYDYIANCKFVISCNGWRDDRRKFRTMRSHAIRLFNAFCMVDYGTYATRAMLRRVFTPNDLEAFTMALMEDLADLVEEGV